jgi:membrane-bound inhibitor of C-type lysozyme
MMRVNRIKRRQRFRTVVCILILAALFMTAGCSGTSYFCENGKIIKTRDQLSGQKVVIDVGDGDIILPRVQAVEGSKFSDGMRTFWFKGDELIVESGGKNPYGRCTLSR